MIYMIAAMTILAWAVILYMLFAEYDDLLTETAPKDDFKTGHSDEVKKNVSWEPDCYKDLSAAKYEDFGIEDLEDVSKLLTSSQFENIRGKRR